MSFITESVGLHPIDNLLLAKQWFDYTPEMNAILNALDKRIFNLEIALQANNQISNRSHTMIDNNLSSPKSNIVNKLSQELVRNSIDTSSPRSARNSLFPDQYSLNLTLEKQMDKFNLSAHVLIPTGKSKFPILPPLNQMKIRAYEFAAIFENTFDQLTIIHNALFTHDFNENNVHSNCNPFGIFIINDGEKFRYEIEYFFHILMLLFRALLLDSQTDFLNSVNHTHNHLALIELTNRLKTSQDKISKLVFIKKHFHTETSQQFDIINSTESPLKDRLIEEKYRSKIALRYSNDWKKNHIFQWIQMLFQIEQDYIKTIHQYETILKQTEITHQETIEILIQQKTEMKFNANKWYEYYQNETSRFERELTSFRYDFNQIKRQRQDLYEEYQRMKIIVDEYNQLKLNEQLILEKQKQQEEAIKRIQAWWRGTMIRHIKRKKK